MFTYEKQNGSVILKGPKPYRLIGNTGAAIIIGAVLFAFYLGSQAMKNTLPGPQFQAGMGILFLAALAFLLAYFFLPSQICIDDNTGDTFISYLHIFRIRIPKKEMSSVEIIEEKIAPHTVGQQGASRRFTVKNVLITLNSGRKYLLKKSRSYMEANFLASKLVEHLQLPFTEYGLKGKHQCTPDEITDPFYRRPDINNRIYNRHDLSELAEPIEAKDADQCESVKLAPEPEVKYTGNLGCVIGGIFYGSVIALLINIFSPGSGQSGNNNVAFFLMLALVSGVVHFFILQPHETQKAEQEKKEKTLMQICDDKFKIETPGHKPVELDVHSIIDVQSEQDLKGEKYIGIRQGDQFHRIDHNMSAPQANRALNILKEEARKMYG